MGLVTGIAFSLWVGFGQPRPPLKMLDFSVEDCSQFGGYNSTTITPIVMAQRLDRPDSDYFYLYRLSYLWSVVLGYVLTFIVGYTVSLTLRWLGHQGTERIYLDNDHVYINTDLFSPPVAKHIKRALARHIENGGEVITK